MSDVHRWKLKGFIPGVEGESKALFQPWVVHADDYDAALARISALQLLLNTADQRNADMQSDLTKARELLSSIKTSHEHTRRYLPPTLEAWRARCMHTEMDVEEFLIAHQSAPAAHGFDCHGPYTTKAVPAA
ncbi:hypothetical protein, partial [Pseudomonas sp. CCI2.4]|uniref:hypothetical protein n=1 Tax=Pseudomonas sp. CCI2.4 TaxID=3048617 RepID=UPI002B2384F5